jgi:hypothetical protein
MDVPGHDFMISRSILFGLMEVSSSFSCPNREESANSALPTRPRQLTTLADSWKMTLCTRPIWRRPSVAPPHQFSSSRTTTMEWKKLVRDEAEAAFAVTRKLIEMAQDDQLGWKPATGTNWMTMGQLLHHLGDAAGMPMRGFLTGDWGLPDGMDMKDIPMEEMLPPAEKMPTVASVAEAIERLEEDRRLALDLLDGADERRLDTERASAPWDPTPILLGHRLLQMVQHLQSHKSQLFYYLKLMGRPVNTMHLWG